MRFKIGTVKSIVNFLLMKKKVFKKIQFKNWINYQVFMRIYIFLTHINQFAQILNLVSLEMALIFMQIETIYHQNGQEISYPLKFINLSGKLQISNYSIIQVMLLKSKKAWWFGIFHKEQRVISLLVLLLLLDVILYKLTYEIFSIFLMKLRFF